METITTAEAQSLTDRQLQDELMHAAYVVATLYATDLPGHAADRLEVFKVLRSETQRRHG